MRALRRAARAGTDGCRSPRRFRRPGGDRAGIPLAACDDSGRMGPDETPRRSGARDLERYAGLFAQRAQAMKSSAMRDLMAVTARPEIISLAGGLPDTSTFPAEDFAALMARVAVDASARAIRAAKSSAGKDRKSTRMNSSHSHISYAVFCLKKEH